MIAGATRGSGSAALSRHLLSRKGGQAVRILEARHLVSEGLRAQIAELVAASRRARTDRPVHHLHVDPPEGADAASVMKVFVTHYEREFGLEDVPKCGVEHVKNGRRHFHWVYSLVRPDGRVASLSHEYARREKVSRMVEFECGLAMIKGKHNRAVAAALKEDDRPDIADAMGAAGLLGGRRQVAPQTPQERAQADRTSLPIADVRVAALDAWRSSDSGPSFAAALKERGFRLAQGDRGPILFDRAGGTHSLTRTLSAAARIEGDRIPAATVKRRLADFPLRTIKEEKTDDRSPGPEAASDAHDLRPVEGRAPHVKATPTSPEPVGAARGAREPGRDQGLADDDRPDPGPAFGCANRAQGPHRTRWTESDRAAIAALRRADVTGIRAQAETIRMRPISHAVRDRAAAHALSRINVRDLSRVAHRMLSSATAGRNWRHPESYEGMDSTMAIKGVGPTSGRRQDYKTKLLEGVVPSFNASPYFDDLHMVKAGGASTPTRILLRDRGWVEIDRRAGIVRAWGQPGRADALAHELAAAGGWGFERLEPSGEAARAGVTTPRPVSVSRHTTDNLVAWWRERGFDAVATPEGAWIDAGGSHLHDTGLHVELHGRLTPDAARALILKANEAWDGSAELSGPWSRPDRDTLWLEAQRAGVELHRCNPSDAARRAWDEEVRAARAHDEAIGLVRTGSREAETLRAAAAGDVAALGRLSPELRAFVSSYLDDEQRKELAEADPADLIPELRRFRSLGADEIAMRRRQPDVQQPDKPGPDDFEQAPREAQDKPKDDSPDIPDLAM